MTMGKLEQRPTRKKKPISRLSLTLPVTSRSWSDEEKWQLLHRLREHSIYDLDKLQEAIPSRSKDEIVSNINVWRKLGSMSLKPYASKKKGVKLTPCVDLLQFVENSLGRDSDHKAPIQKWLDYMEENTPTNLFRRSRLIAKAFKYIANYENHLSPEELGVVNLKDLYEFMHCVLNGDPTKWLNKESVAFLFRSLDHLKVESEKIGCVIENFLQNVDKIDYSENGKIGKSIFNLSGFNAFQMPDELLQWDSSLDTEEVIEIIKSLSSSISIMKDKVSTVDSKEIVDTKNTNAATNKLLQIGIKIENCELEMDSDINTKQNIAAGAMLTSFSDNTTLRNYTRKNSTTEVPNIEQDIATKIDKVNRVNLVTAEDIKIEKDLSKINENISFNQLENVSLSENKTTKEATTEIGKKKVSRPTLVNMPTHLVIERKKRPCKRTQKATFTNSESNISLNSTLISNEANDIDGDKDYSEVQSNTNISLGVKDMQKNTKVRNARGKNIRKVSQTKIKDSVKATLDKAPLKISKSVRKGNQVNQNSTKLKKEKNKKTVYAKSVCDLVTNTSEITLEIDKQESKKNSPTNVQQAIKIYTIEATFEISSHEHKETIATKMQCDLKDKIHKVNKSKSKQTKVKKDSFSTNIKHSNARRSKKNHSSCNQHASDTEEDIRNKTTGNKAVNLTEVKDNIASGTTFEISSIGTTSVNVQNKVSNACEVALEGSKKRGRKKSISKLQREIVADKVEVTFQEENIHEKESFTEDSEYETDKDEGKHTKVKDDSVADLVKYSNIRRSERISSINLRCTNTKTGFRRAFYNRKCKNRTLDTVGKEGNLDENLLKNIIEEDEEDNPNEVEENITAPNRPSIKTYRKKSKKTIATKRSVPINVDLNKGSLKNYNRKNEDMTYIDNLGDTTDHYLQAESNDCKNSESVLTTTDVNTDINLGECSLNTNGKNKKNSDDKTADCKLLVKIISGKNKKNCF